jgi:hypothetical protein
MSEWNEREFPTTIRRDDAEAIRKYRLLRWWLMEKTTALEHLSSLNEEQRAKSVEFLEKLRNEALHSKILLEGDLEQLIQDQERASKIALPPGYWMERVAGTLFFFSPKTVERVFHEIIGAYQHEIIKAEAAGARRSRLLSLRVQYWGGFLWSIVDKVAFGFVGKIMKAIKGG